MVWLGLAAPAQSRSRGPHEPVHSPDFGLTASSVVLTLDFQGRNVVTVKSAVVGPGQAHGRRGEPPILRFQLRDSVGNLLEEFNAWHPLWRFRFDGAGNHERRELLTQATGRFVIPFYPTMTHLDLIDVGQNAVVLGSNIADLGIVSMTPIAPPTQILAGQPATVTIRTTVVNNGPATPIDLLLRTAATADAGGVVTPAQQEASAPGLALSETRVLDQSFTVRCDTPGAHTFQFAGDVRSANAGDIDLVPANNKATATFTLDCVVPVTINIKPKGFPNSINLGATTVPLAVLTTVAGDYGLPLAFNATTINPLSVRFGDETLVWTGTGGSRERHDRLHVEDSYELDETTRDGDLDMVLHFPQDPAQSGLTDSHTKACVKGEFLSGGQRFRFFGCDSVNIVPH